MGRSRGGLTTKIHALVDAEGRPIRIALTPGQAHDGTAAEEPTRDPELYSHASSRPGAKLPHAWLTTDHRRRVSTLDLGGHGRFTVFTGIGGESWVRAAAVVADRLGIEVSAVQIGPGRDHDDLYGDWAGVRGIDDGGVLLVRPDNYVAFRRAGAASDAEAEQALETALRTVLDRTSEVRA